MTAYYNEIDPFAAAWLRELIKEGHIAPGDVDERSIEDVKPNELDGYAQCHFFAGIGVWSHALRAAGWPDSRPVWTGSCPCQPFSAAGKGGGFTDERHLWPSWHHLIAQCQPIIVFGEQVEAAVRHGWLDLVQADLEGCGYAVGAAGIPAAGVGAPHIRQRLWFVADAASSGRQQFSDVRPARVFGSATGAQKCVQQLSPDGASFGQLADAPSDRRAGGGEGRPTEERRQPGSDAARQLSTGFEGRSDSGGMEHTSIDRREQWWAEPSERSFVGGRGIGGLANTAEPRPLSCAQPGVRRGEESSRPRNVELERPCDIGGVDVAERQRKLRSGGNGISTSIAAQSRGQENARLDEVGNSGQINGLWGAPGHIAGVKQREYDWPRPSNSFWSNPDWLHCRDGRWRPVEPGTFPLAHGAAARVGRLRGYGNAINAEAAKIFIEAYLQGRDIRLTEGVFA